MEATWRSEPKFDITNTVQTTTTQYFQARNLPNPIEEVSHGSNLIFTPMYHLCMHNVIFGQLLSVRIILTNRSYSNNQSIIILLSRHQLRQFLRETPTPPPQPG